MQAEQYLASLRSLTIRANIYTRELDWNLDAQWPMERLELLWCLNVGDGLVRQPRHLYLQAASPAASGYTRHAAHPLAPTPMHLQVARLLWLGRSSLRAVSCKGCELLGLAVHVEGVCQLLDAPMPRLETLDLSFTAIGDEHLQRLPKASAGTPALTPAPAGAGWKLVRNAHCTARLARRLRPRCAR